MIDQNALPFSFKIYEAKSYSDTCHSIITMITRGAGAIGAAAGFAMAQAFLEGAKDEERKAKRDDYNTVQLEFFDQARKEIEATRPTARNLFYATERVYNAGLNSPESALAEAQKLAEANIADAKKIGEFGNSLIKNGSRILTHCNAGWLGFVDYGSALAPMYIAKEQGKDFFVYADETRPRSQGARLTAWELQNEGIPHKIVPDNAGAYLMSKGMIDFVITGADRIAANGDTANKVGTYLKALAAHAHGVPFYVAAPLSTIDFECATGVAIPIEERSAEELGAGTTPVANPAFDVTPAHLIGAIISERGVAPAGALWQWQP